MCTFCQGISSYLHELRQTGILVFGPSDCDYVIQTAESLRKNSVHHKMFSGKEANRKYLQLKIPDNYKCVFESDGGILFANMALLAFQVMCIETKIEILLRK